jgi:hypothetical protein
MMKIKRERDMHVDDDDEDKVLSRTHQYDSVLRAAEDLAAPLDHRHALQLGLLLVGSMDRLRTPQVVDTCDNRQTDRLSVSSVSSSVTCMHVCLSVESYPSDSTVLYC